MITRVGALVLALGLAACAAGGAAVPTAATPVVEVSVPASPSASPTPSATESPHSSEVVPSEPTGPLLTGSPVSAEDADDNFALRITADQDRYRAGQPITVSATLTYLGPGEAETLLASGSSLVGYTLEREDPPLAIHSAFTSDCSPYQITRAEPTELPFNKSGGFADDDPHAEFYESYFRSPDLRLPAGTWQIWVGASFATGADCGSEPHNLSAGVTITVEP